MMVRVSSQKANGAGVDDDDDDEEELAERGRKLLSKTLSFNAKAGLDAAATAAAAASHKATAKKH